MRYVLISFAFLGWAFYELSGGADFEPRGLRPPPPDPRVAAAPVAPSEASALVARPAIAPRKTPPAALPARALQDRAVPARAEMPAADRVELSRALALFPAGEPGPEVAFVTGDGRVASLSEIAAAPRPTAAAPRPRPAAEPEQDIREVSGTRVNMRDGPGTIYPVIGRLRIGQKVEVLDDSGTGWLRLRPVGAPVIGWAAASLIADLP